ncbi:hypothetical protein GCM10011371_20660 [Novosphingobium marinum]|uniref:Putative membrane protein n=1 Tax=Novosphingobium marinum TaxID=1514948 RepID=A0A7Y9Y011_9SPHN|nr:DUF2254 domain-containing protein [Novosphingobium marinum]NYH96178.1 putative membrane protein [Novosphingobium marinum]GGC33130.1 hypothetical protein GCM10011371_20660 [Novosphingobium marinum]
MIARLRSIWFSINASYWFYPALFAAAGLVLAFGLVYVDRIWASEWLSTIEALTPARPDGASNMLTVLAGSMIGVASTVFSITIAAVAYASGTYGPRLLTNFMEDKGNQLSLATFIGTFVYAITVLRSVRSEDEAPIVLTGAAAQGPPGFVPQLSLLVAFGLMILSVAVLVYFLHHIPSSIRINTVLENIGKRLLAMIEHRFPDPNKGPAPEVDMPDGTAVLATSRGYIRLLEMQQLRELAEERGISIGLSVRAGDFVYPGITIAHLDCGDCDDDLAEAVRDCFALGGSRTPEQDLEFSIDELVEIAQRALSPGINDPFTAITAVHWLSAATAELGQRELRNPVRGEREEDDRLGALVPLQDDFDHFVARGFGATRSAIAASRLAALVTLDGLANAGRLIDDESRRATLLREAGLLLAQAEKSLTGPDLHEVRARHVLTKRALET